MQKIKMLKLYDIDMISNFTMTTKIKKRMMYYMWGEVYTLMTLKAHTGQL